MITEKYLMNLQFLRNLLTKVLTSVSQACCFNPLRVILEAT